jgi:soluble lytic murein transglycosylase-like protein
MEIRYVEPEPVVQYLIDDVDVVKLAADKDRAGLSSLIIQQARKHGIPEDVAFALVSTESDFLVRAVSSSGWRSGLGLTQVSQIGLKEYNNYNGTSYTKDHLYNAERNLDIGFWLFAHYSRRYVAVQTWEQLYIKYNVGPTAYRRNYASYYANDIHPDGSRYNARTRFNDHLANIRSTLVAYNVVY